LLTSGTKGIEFPKLTGRERVDLHETLAMVGEKGKLVDAGKKGSQWKSR